MEHNHNQALTAADSRTLERRTFKLSEIRAPGEGDSRTVSGYAAMFNSPSVQMGKVVEKIAPGAFARSLAEEDIVAFWNHNYDIPLARSSAKTLVLSEDETGLKFSFDMPRSAWGDSVLEAIKRRDVTGMSFGFFVRNIDGENWTKMADGNWQRMLTDLVLIEVSPVVWPAYPATSVDARSTEGFERKVAELEARANEQEAAASNLSRRAELLKITSSILGDMAHV